MGNKAATPTGPAEGDLFPECRLAVLQAGKDIPYLDLNPGSRYFSLSDIKGNYILVEVYNEICTLCLAELPNIDRLLRLINADSDLRGRVKMLGLGAGSTKRSVAKFRRKKRFDLPLFADEKSYTFGLLGKPMLPVLYLLKKDGENDLRIIWRYSGGIGNPEDFLEYLKRYTTKQARGTAKN